MRFRRGTADDQLGNKSHLLVIMGPILIGRLDLLHKELSGPPPEVGPGLPDGGQGYGGRKSVV